jgi:ATP-binding cassette subfamily G (WHITE) protein 2 (PDR)
MLNRNFGALWGLIFLGLTVYLVSTELVSSKRSKGEVLLFPRGKLSSMNANHDEESPAGRGINFAMGHATKVKSEVPPSIQRQTAIFHWDAVNYDIKIKKEPRRLLDEIDGWVKPGTLTALMVCSTLAKH